MKNKLENGEIALRLSGIKKVYKLGQIGGGTLQGDLQSWWAKVRGRDDPNIKIGQEQRLIGQTFMALNGIDLTVYKGERVGIIGANGAGKSTMLKLLSRVTAPTEGEISIWGRIASMLEVGTGFNGEMTGRENVYMNGAILGMSKAEIDAKMENIIEFSEVREFIDTPVKRYSSGMYVKLAFSVAAHLDAEIMIMDEVLAVGDMAFQKKCLNKMSDVSKIEGRTILYVSHNMNTIRQLCERVIVLDKGRIIFDGDVEEAIEVYMGTAVDLKSKYSFDRSFHTDKGSKLVYLKELSIVNKQQDREFHPRDHIVVQVCCDVRSRCEGVRFRFEIQYCDGTVAAACFSNRAIDLLETGTFFIKMELDTSALAPGRYKADMVVYSIDPFGNDVYIDGVIPALFFELKESDSVDENSIWLHKYWGHVRLNDIVIEEYCAM